MKNALITIGWRTILLFGPLMCLSTSLLVALPVSAATVPVSSAQKTMDVHPQASGGGCLPNAGLVACISENSDHFIEPDAYVTEGSACNVEIDLKEDGKQVTGDFHWGCASAVTHLWGAETYAVPGHSWRTTVCATDPISGGTWCVDSPYLYS